MPIQTQFPISFFESGGSGKAELNTLLAKFSPADQTADVAAVVSDNTAYMVYPVGDGRCIGFALGLLSGVAQNANNITSFKEFTAVHAVDNTGLTESGVFSTTSGSTFWGGYRRSSKTEDAYVELVTPDGVVDVGGFLSTSINAGIILVTIDGDRTLATELPTAQDLVDNETLVASALTTNGGILNPTDRVLDLFSTVSSGAGNPFQWRYFAKGLTPGSHTVRYVRTGYKNISGSNSNLYISGMFYRVAGETLPASDECFIPKAVFNAPASRLEFAISTQPVGASIREWMGHSGTEYHRSTPELSVDGTPTDWPTDIAVRGKSIRFTLDTYLRHPDTGITDIGLVTRSYTLTAAGLQHDFTLTWQVDVEVRAAYPCMLAAEDIFDRGSMVGAGTDYTLTANDGTNTPKVPSQVGYFWQSAGNWALAMHIPDLATVHNYSAPDCGMWLTDREGSLSNKCYAERNTQSLAVDAQTVWEGCARFLGMYFADGAEGALARPT